MNNTKKSPPKIAAWILSKLIDRSVRDQAMGDFEERYYVMASKNGLFFAGFYYRLQILAVIPAFIKNSIFWSFIMFGNYLKIAFRNIRKQKAYTFINIFGLSVGMAISILILLWVQDELSYDNFHQNINRFYRVVVESQNDNQLVLEAQTPIPLSEQLKLEFPEIVNTSRYFDNQTSVEFKYDNQILKIDRIAAVDPAFFELFSFSLIKGDPKTALNDPFSMLISEEYAKKWFGNEEPIGKILKIAEREKGFTITGVIKDIPHNSHLRFDGLWSFNFIREFGLPFDKWDFSLGHTYVLLQKSSNADEFTKKITNLIKKHDPYSKKSLFIQPVKEIYLNSNFSFDLAHTGNITYVYLFSLIAIFILLIACINFINLTTAQSLIRAKEIGLRKVAGAKRSDLIIQFFGESILMSIIAIFLAVLIVSIFLPTFNHLVFKQLTLDPFEKRNVLFSLLVVTLFTGIVSGSYPAIFLSSFKPVKVITNSIRSYTGKSNYRQILVVFQFSVSIFLIIATSIVFKQIQYTRTRDLGYKKENLIYFLNREDFQNNFSSIKEDLLKNPNIISITKTQLLPIKMYQPVKQVNWEKKDPGEEIYMHDIIVSYDYIKTFDMKLISGRAFSKKYDSDSFNYILNEKAIEAIGLTAEEAIGKKFSIHGREGVIIGVVADFHTGSFKHKIDPVVLRLGDCYFSCIKIKSDNITETLANMEKIWKRFVPDYPLNYYFLDQSLDNLYTSEKRLGKIFGHFTVLAVFISCLGLIGLTSYLSQKKRKEIGIRKVFGAGIISVVYNMSKHYFLLLIIANIIACPIAYYVMSKWLQGFVYRINIDLETFILAGFTVFVISLFTISYQSIKAAVANPVDSLRNE
ncbi:ABC transporter permease [candidate division KSB1 bacterium]